MKELRKALKAEDYITALSITAEMLEKAMDAEYKLEQLDNKLYDSLKEEALETWMRVYSGLMIYL